METSAATRKATKDYLAYFLAGHQVPAGVYRDMQTGREIPMEEAGVLPATFDGHVAVYVRLPLTWAEMDDPERDKLSEEGASLMHPSPVFCEPCAQAGVITLADYVYQSEEISLAGPTMGDPDYWPPDVNGQRLLCQAHYADLPADGQLNYVAAEGHLGQSAGM